MGYLWLLVTPWQGHGGTPRTLPRIHLAVCWGQSCGLSAQSVTGWAQWEARGSRAVGRGPLRLATRSQPRCWMTCPRQCLDSVLVSL